MARPVEIIREMLNWEYATHQQAANELGYTRNYLVKILNMDNPSPLQLIKIYKRYKKNFPETSITLDYIFDEFEV